jgi:hypothetical protein
MTNLNNYFDVFFITGFGLGITFTLIVLYLFGYL